MISFNDLFLTYSTQLKSLNNKYIQKIDYKNNLIILSDTFTERYYIDNFLRYDELVLVKLDKIDLSQTFIETKFLEKEKLEENNIEYLINELNIFINDNIHNVIPFEQSFRDYANAKLSIKNHLLYFLQEKDLIVNISTNTKNENSINFEYKNIRLKIEIDYERQYYRISLSDVEELELKYIRLKHQLVDLYGILDEIIEKEIKNDN